MSQFINEVHCTSNLWKSRTANFWRFRQPNGQKIHRLNQDLTTGPSDYQLSCRSWCKYESLPTRLSLDRLGCQIKNSAEVVGSWYMNHVYFSPVLDLSPLSEAWHQLWDNQDQRRIAFARHWQPKKLCSHLLSGGTYSEAQGAERLHHTWINII